MNDNIIKQIQQEYRIADDGSVTLSIRGVARLAGVTGQALTRQFSADKQKHSKLAQALTEKGFNVPSFSRLGIPKNAALEIIKHYYQQGKFTEAGCKAIGMPVPQKRKKYSSEKKIQQRMARRLKGKTEVPTEAGSIDVLTSTELIEIKEAKSWKSGLGQLLVYGAYYPSHSKRLHLFGSCHSSYLDMATKHCRRFGVLLTWETQSFDKGLTNDIKGKIKNPT